MLSHRGQLDKLLLMAKLNERKKARSAPLLLEYLLDSSLKGISVSPKACGTSGQAGCPNHSRVAALGGN